MIALIFILTVASLDDLAISIPGGSSRQFIFTNKEAGFLTGETSSENTSSYNGWFVQLHKYLEDYEVMLGPDRLGPSSLDSVLVYPDRLVRFHGLHNSRETLTLLDSLNAVSVEVETDYVGEVSIVPRVSFRGIWEVRKADYKVAWDDWLAVQRKDWNDTDFPVILGVKTNLETSFEESPHTVSRTYPKDLRRRAMVSDFPFSPGRLSVNRRTEKIVLVFAVGKTRAETEEILESVHSELESMKEKRRARMERLLADSHIQTSNEEYNTALRWAILSLDALVMNHPFRGIYAGLFWFPTFWGRDTFISLPGACLVLGRFELAREIIRSAARYQKEGGKDEGRLPNLIVPGQVYYNTTDATHWFIKDVWELVRSTGDVGFLKEMFPTVQRAIEGALARRTDEAHLLTHGEAETWMDAGGESNPRSPRGNRAVEVQALWYNSLVNGAEMASLLGKSRLGAGWRERADSVKVSFRTIFWDPNTRSLVDHINPDGTRDTKKRPNQLFAVTVPTEPLLSPAEERGVMEFTRSFLLEPHGVLSLSRDDPDFHPYHIDWDSYHFDEAYHNGDVWLWLAGPMVEVLVRNGETETAWQATSHLTDVLLRKGAVGTLPELENGSYLAQEENLEGTITQAWSLAEYIRTFYHAYLGVRHDGLTKKIRFEPALPAELGSVRFLLRIAEAVVEVEYAESATERSYSFFSAEMDSPHQLELVVRVLGGEPLRFSGELTGGERLTVFVRRDAQGEWKMLPSRYRVH